VSDDVPESDDAEGHPEGPGEDVAHTQYLLESL
jgi:hypothetical protein